MKVSKVRFIIVAAFIAFLSAAFFIQGCSQLPEPEALDSARTAREQQTEPDSADYTFTDLETALISAKEAMAITYAPEEWKKCLTAMDGARKQCADSKDDVCKRIFVDTAKLIRNAENIARRRRGEAEATARDYVGESYELYKHKLKPEKPEEDEEQ